MRVISQDGNFDVNYENATLEIYDSNSIFAYTDATQPRQMAKYSSRGNALKAMEQLGDAYMKNEYYLSIISGAINIATPQEEEIKDCRKLLETAMSSSVFRFPADEELE